MLSYLLERGKYLPGVLSAYIHNIRQIIIFGTLLASQIGFSRKPPADVYIDGCEGTCMVLHIFAVRPCPLLTQALSTCSVCSIYVVYFQLLLSIVKNKAHIFIKLTYHSPHEVLHISLTVYFCTHTS